MNLKKYGPWALITGASSGIGKAFAKQLATYGFNLVLVARRKERLDVLANQLSTKYSIQVKTIGQDLMENHFIKIIRETTDSLDIGLVVNNAGMWLMGKFQEITIEDNMAMIDLNIKAPQVLTHHFGQKMITRQGGGIINVASLLAYTGVPHSVSYAATKAFELVNGEGLWQEWKKYGVDVLTLNPGITSTEMTASVDFSHMPMSLMKPESVVKTALKSLGKKSQVVPGRTNKFLAFAIKHILPRDINTKIFGQLMGKAYRNTSKSFS